ncbi:MAG: cysteine desulfurase NifS [Candidatus Aenigmarchaeota archaeon ex4484_14]|nr:MAG: cysteine desulfurase NifS [Candidatus Aenigmarchaeota archaeon ex4484_14]RLJ04997.1 MAG: cysteine desulfurase NifS [Candidatus Aenigmarchaeota archaeon]
MKKIYLDYAATTPVDKRVLEEMKPYFSEKYGNASSLHSLGTEAKRALEEAREKVASVIKANPKEIIFTSSGTESNNTALKGVAFANRDKGKHIITTPIEHDCVLNSARWLKKQGFDVDFIPVDKYGLVDLEKLEELIRKDTILISVMHANNEIGTIEPIKEIGKIAKEHDVYFHTDAAQSYGKIDIDVKKMNIDLITANAHKIYGPKGVGALFIREGVKIDPLLHGGGHEFGLRSSTENVAGIVGFGKAAELAKKEMRGESERLIKLRNTLIENILKIDDCWLNGHPDKRLPNNANFSFRFIEGESLVMYLDMQGICASTGSACSSKSLEPSHVLTAIGLKPEEAHGSLRLTTGRFTTKEDIDYVVEVLPNVVKNLRKLSPLK